MIMEQQRESKAKKNIDGRKMKEKRKGTVASVRLGHPGSDRQQSCPMGKKKKSVKLKRFDKKAKGEAAGHEGTFPVIKKEGEIDVL